VLKCFSRRTSEIEELAAERGITDPERKSELGAKTRKAKNKELPWDKLVEEWWSRLTPEEADALDAIAENRRAVEPESREQESVDHALAHCYERASVVSEKQLLAEALRFGLGSVTVKGIEKELGNRLLIRREVEGRVMVTTPEILAEEQRIVAYAREGRGKCRPLVGFDRPIVDHELNDQQQRAVRNLWQSPDRLLLLHGAAGVGKTRLLKEAIAGMESAGQRVVALAQSADASRGVLREEAKIASADTVARFLVDEKFQEQARKGVILIDEASLLGTRTMAKVIDKAKQLEARLILVGDEKQHGPIERGAAFRLLQEKAALPVAQVTEIQRQKGDYRAAVKALSEGRVLEGFDQLDRLGWVEELPDGKREQRMAADYLRITKERKANGEERSCLIVAPTNQEAAQITEAVRGSLRKAKRLGEDREVTAWLPVHLTEAERADGRNYATGDMLVFHKAAPGHRTGERLVVEEGTKLPLSHADRFQVFRPKQLALAAGDRIRLTANVKSKDGGRLNNGTLHSVRGFTSCGDVTLDNGHVVKKDFLALQPGFVVTSYSSQGKTYDAVLVGQSSDSMPATSKEQAYVAWSRGRDSVHIYTDDKEALRDSIQHSDPRLLAHDLLPARRSPVKPRLKKHLAFIRRLATFARTHAPATAARELGNQQREMQP